MELQGVEALSNLLGHGLGRMFQPRTSLIGDFGDFVFFQFVLDRLEHDIREFGDGVIGRVMQVVQWVALGLLTIWIFIQGYRVMTGQLRESMMGLVTNSLRAVLIVTAAVSFSTFDEPITRYVTTDMKDGIHWVVTGEEGSPEDEIDSNLGWMQVAMSSVDVLESGGDIDGAQEKDRAVTMIGMGTAGPAVIGGALLLMYQVAMALFIGLGPIFILCLLFNSTKSLFQRWLLYGIGTMFSMAVLSAMVSIALRMVTDVAMGLWAADAIGTLLLGGADAVGYSSRAMQSGGMGIILTLLLLTVPPMAANFFQGTLGSFMHYTAFAAGGTTAAAPSAYGPPGAPTPSAYTPAQRGTTGSETGGRMQLSSYGSASLPSYAAAGLSAQSVEAGMRQGSQVPGREAPPNPAYAPSAPITSGQVDSPPTQMQTPKYQAPPPKDDAQWRG